MSGLFGTQAKSQPAAIGALSIQQSTYSIPVTIVYGTNRIPGNLIWYGAFNQVLVSTGGQSGKGGIVGGGGKGGGSQQYNYYASFQIGICQGTINNIGQVWATKQQTNMSSLGGSVFTGALGQAPWGYLTTNFPANAIGYNLLAHGDFSNFNLGTSPEIPQFSFEVISNFRGTGTPDGFADQIISDFIGKCNFPSSYLGSFTSGVTSFANYCNSLGWFISPVVDQQRQATDWLKEWMDTLNSEFVWSGGLLSIVPYGDTAQQGNGYTYTPNLTPVYALTDSDFLVKGDEDPVEIDRADLPDAYNQMPIEYINRADQYNVETFIAEDQAMIDNYGVRIGSSLSAHHICDPNIAQAMAYIKLWRSIYIEKGNSYTFKLPWNFILLDPMDLVSLTTGTLLNNVLVRIKKISEDEDGTLTFTAEDVPGAIASGALYYTQGTQRFSGNYNSEPSSVNTPVIFETPLALVQSSDVEVNLAVSGGTNWGGCQIWVSSDGVNYLNVGNIDGAARQGVLTANLPTYTPTYQGQNIDTINTLSINMTESMSSFNSAATDNDAVVNNTLCYVDGEFISFGNDVLTSQYNYNLTYLNRGAYYSTIGAHSSGANFVRYDAAVYRYPIDQTRIGATLYFKFPSFNVYGGGLQSLDEVPEYSYTVTGSALLTPLANIASLAVNYSNNIAQLNWSPITDIRSPIYYEIRKGLSWAGGQFIGRTAAPNFAVYGTDTYWVSPLFLTPTGVAVYSSTPPSISVTAPAIQQNVVESYDEEATGWTGVCTGNAVVSGSSIIVAGTGTDFLPNANILTVPNLLGAGTSQGIYTAPTGHIINSNYVCNATVVANWLVAGVNVSGAGDITAIGDITTVADITDAADQGSVSAQVQVNLSLDGGTTWSGWQNWTPGVYTFNRIKFQIIITTDNPQVNAVLSGFSYNVNVQQYTQTGSVATTNSGASNVTFANTFNQTPLVQLTIANPSSGDIAVLTGEATTGFSVEVLNSGSPVARTVNWSATSW